MPLPPTTRRLGCLTMKTTFCWVELGVTDVTKVNGTEQRIGLGYALQRPHRANPQHDRQTETPPRRQAECEAPGDHHHHQHQFAVATEQEIRPIGRLVDEYLSWFVGRVHNLNHRRSYAERAGQHGRREY